MFLQNRQAAFKEAALVAKRKGDRAAAIDYLRKMKGFDSMIEAAKNGLKVSFVTAYMPLRSTLNMVQLVNWTSHKIIILKMNQLHCFLKG